MSADVIILVFLLIFALLVMLIFGWRRRWLGMAGWLLVVSAFILSGLFLRSSSLTHTTLAVLAICAGIGLAGMDYLRYERRKRR